MPESVGSTEGGIRGMFKWLQSFIAQIPDSLLSLTNILNRCLQLQWVGKCSFLRQDGKCKDGREGVSRCQGLRIL